MTTEQKALERLNWHIHANRFGKETLEALNLAREALQKQPRWIPVTERLPESPEYDWVLVATKMIPEGWYGVPHVAELRNGKWRDQYNDGDFEKMCGVKVTHWMPMLDNPEEGDAE